MKRISFPVACILLLVTLDAPAKTKHASLSPLPDYLHRLELVPSAPPSRTPGSLWLERGKLASPAVDYKARHVGDVLVITVSQDTTADNSGSVSTARSFNASSGVDKLVGRLGAGASGFQNMFSPHSTAALTGKAQASSKSALRTILSGRVVAELANGSLVIEAEREILFNNEHQRVLVRGVARPGDVGPDNTVTSGALSDLEIEIAGKGVLSDGTRRPNIAIRFLLGLLNF